MIIPSTVDFFFSNNFEDYKSLSKKHQCALCRTWWHALTRRHKAVIGAFWQDKDSRDKDYGRGIFYPLHERLGLIRKVCNGGPSKGYADALALTDKGRELLDKFLSMVRAGGDAFPITVRRLIDENGIACRSYEHRNAISSRTASGGRTSFAPAKRFPALVTIDRSRLLALADACELWLSGRTVRGFAAEVADWNNRRALDHGKAMERVRRVRDSALLVCHVADCVKQDGCKFPVVYVEQSTGRLYAEGALNLQTVPREVRKAALHGCWAYDVSNCHWALMQQLARQLGLSTPAIDAYISRKKETRAEIAEQAGIHVSAAKTVLISLIYGANIYAQGEGSAIVEAAGVEGAKRLRSCQVLKSLHAEVQSIGSAVVAHYEAKEKQGRLINEMGRQYDESRDKAGKDSRLSFILQGIEAQILSVVIERHEHQLKALLHDGWVTSEAIDASELGNAIFAETGFRVAIECDQLHDA